MRPDSSDQLRARSIATARWIGIFGIVVGAFGVLIPALARPHPLSPVSVLLSALAIVLAVDAGSPPWRLRLAKVCAGLVVLQGILGVLDAIPGLHPAGTTSPTFEACFLLLGLVLLLEDHPPFAGRPVQFASLLVGAAALMALLGTLYGVRPGHVLLAGLHAPPTMAAALLIVALGTVLSRPDRGLMIVLTSPNAGGRAVRRLLPIAVLMPVLFGELKVLGMRAGYSGTDLGPITVIALVAFFLGLTWIASRRLHEEELARARAEMDLAETRERLQAIADHTTSLIFLKDLQGRFLFVNRQYERIVGKLRDEVIGRTAHDLFAADVADRLAADDRRTLAAGGPIEIEDVHALEDGEHCFLTVEFPVFDAAGRIRALGGLATDITQRKRTDAQLREARDELQRLVQEKTHKLEETGAMLIHAQKMEPLGRLAGGVAHDFNNLLSVILSYSELALLGMAPQDPRRGDLLEIQKAGNRAAVLVRQLLAFGRRQVLQPRTLPLNGLITDVEKMLRRLIGEDVAFSFVPGAEVGAIHVDPSQFEQILVNLVVNARDAMPRGGRLTIATESVVLDEAFVRANAGARAGFHEVLKVTDTGTGMDVHTLAHLFEPFFTTKEVGKGTGLGLSTVYGIVKQSTGYIRVESQPTVGTTFFVYFPGVVTESGALESGVVPSAAGGSETLLLVEDEEAVRQPIRLWLAAAGYRVLEAANADEAVVLAARFAGTIHLVITDLVMPGMRGVELVELLQSSRPAIKVLLMTGYTEEDVPVDAAGRSLYPVFLKPIVLEPFSRAVRQALDTTT